MLPYYAASLICFAVVLATSYATYRLYNWAMDHDYSKWNVDWIMFLYLSSMVVVIIAAILGVSWMIQSLQAVQFNLEGALKYQG